MLRPREQCHHSKDETGRAQGGGRGAGTRDEEMNTGVRGREEHSRCMGKEGRQADGEGVRKDKERTETVAGFKGCRLAWPWRSHEVYGSVVCWSRGICWLFQVTLSVLGLSGPATDLFSRNVGKSETRTRLGPFSPLFD